MSATFPNIEDISLWLNGIYYISEFRPVEVKEFVKLGKSVVDKTGLKVREVGDLLIKGDYMGVIPLIRETVDSGGQVLVFCQSKRECERLAGLYT
jgi:DNA polymerase theta